VARFDINKPLADYTDDELRAMPKYKQIRSALQSIREEEVFRLILRDIEGRRKKYFAKQLQTKTKSFVGFLNKRGFTGHEWAIQLGDDGSYIIIPLTDYEDPDAPVTPSRTEPKKAIQTVQSPNGRKITRNYSPDDNYDGPKTMSGIIEEAKKKGQALAKKQEAVQNKKEKTQPLLHLSSKAENSEIASRLNEFSIAGNACPDLECSGLMTREGKVRGTKGLPAWYCEECNTHYVYMKPPGNRTEHYITLERFLEWVKTRKIKDVEQAEKRAEKETESHKWELVTWEQIEAWRRENHLTKKRVAKLAGINKHSFYQWGQGVHIPSLANQQKLKDLISRPLKLAQRGRGRRKVWA